MPVEWASSSASYMMTRSRSDAGINSRAPSLPYAKTANELLSMVPKRFSNSVTISGIRTRITTSAILPRAFEPSAGVKNSRRTRTPILKRRSFVQRTQSSSLASKLSERCMRPHRSASSAFSFGRLSKNTGSRT